MSSFPISVAGHGARNCAVCKSGRIAVIWIDWYAYHVARFRALALHPLLEGRVDGIELVGRAGVHGRLVFREKDRSGLPITTLLPECGWADASQFRLVRKVWAKLNDRQPDVVLIPGYYTLPALAATVWARWNRRRAVLMSESTLEDHSRHRLKEAMKRTAVRWLFESSIAGGERQIAFLETLGFRRERVARFYDVVDNDYFAAESARWRREATPEMAGLPEKYFLYVGRLAIEKNVDGLIRAFAEYRRNGGTWSLVLAGDGPQRNNLCELAKHEGLAQLVHFAGMKSTAEIPACYAFAGCFVLPSQREPWGLVVNEAMASGLPILLSDRCGCFDDLLDWGGNGYGFDPARPDELTRLLGEIGDSGPERLAFMGNRSREIISRYSLQHWAEEVIRIADIGDIARRTVD